MLQEHELGLHGRDFPGELFVLGDELLEEGDDAFVIMLVCFHVSESGAYQTDIPTPVRVRRKGADCSREGRGAGRRPISLSAKTPWGQPRLILHG